MGRGGHGAHRRFEEDTKEKPLDYWKIARKTAPLLWPENLHLKARVVLVVVTLISARIANVMVPQLYKDAIDMLSGAKVAPVFPLYTILAYSALKIFTSLQRDVRAFVWLDVEQDTSRRIKLQVFSHLHALSHQYHLNRKTGEVLKVMERGASSLQDIRTNTDTSGASSEQSLRKSLLNMALFTIGPNFIDVCLVCLLLWWDGTGLIYSVIIFATMLMYVFATVQMNEWRKKFRKDMIDSENALNDRAVNSLINFETVKFFGMERTEAQQLQSNVLTYNKASWKNETSLYALNSAQQGVIAAGGLACMYYSGREVVAGTMTVGEFVMIQTYLMQLAQPLSWLGTAWRIIQQSFIDMEKMFALLEVEPDIKDDKNAEELDISKGAISFDNVKFSYDNFKSTILKNLSFEVKGGESIAFVGATGAGKSTIARLLFRFYDLPDSSCGSIFIDGQDIRHVTMESLRLAIGVVPQDAVLFNESIRYNLMYSRPDATVKEMKEAAKAAAVYDTIMAFPKKFDTKVGERGLRLSGGEKQRVAIARTILKNPKIVLLDEATSALDTHTEHRIQDALERVCKGRTTIIIAHRLSTIIHSNTIAVLKDGSIAESGTHADLLQREDGLYADMWRAQLQERDKSDASDGIGNGEGGGAQTTKGGVGQATKEGGGGKCPFHH